VTEQQQRRTATEIIEHYGFCTFCVLLPFGLPWAIALVQSMEATQ